MRPKVLRATKVVLSLLCLMYFLTYLDRVNISTAMASNEFLRELTKTQAGLVFSARLALTICGTIWASATIMMGMVHGLVMMFVA